MSIWHKSEIHCTTFLSQYVNQRLREGDAEGEEQVLLLVTIRHPLFLAFMTDAYLAKVGLYQITDDYIALHLVLVVRTGASLSHLLAGDGKVIVRFLWLSLFGLGSHGIELVWELQWLVLISHVVLKYSAPTSWAEAIAIAFSLVVIEYLGIA